MGISIILQGASICFAAQTVEFCSQMGSKSSLLSPPPLPKPLISTYKNCHSRFCTQSLCHSTPHWRLRRIFDKRISLSLCNISFQVMRNRRQPQFTRSTEAKKNRFLPFFFLANFKFSRFGIFYKILLRRIGKFFHMNASQFLFNSLIN